MSKRALLSVAFVTALVGFSASAAGQQAPLRPGGSIQEPKKIVDVKPVYPEIAQQAKIQGIVILEITVGVDGSVTDARVLRPAPMLDQAALDAVRQWKYQPTLLNGMPVPVIMTVTVTFSLNPGTVRPSPNMPESADVASLLDYAKTVHAKGLLAETEQVLTRALQAVQQERIRSSADTAGALTPLRVGANSPAGIPAPAVISSVSPANVVGVTIVEVVIDIEGRVTDAKILRSSGAATDSSVAEAVRQWRFAPTVVNGRAVPVIMTITVR